jgi:hypothetical protein
MTALLKKARTSAIAGAAAIVVIASLAWKVCFGPPMNADRTDK